MDKPTNNSSLKEKLDYVKVNKIRRYDDWETYETPTCDNPFCDDATPDFVIDTFLGT